MPYEGTTPLYVHGPVGLSVDRRHFAHADGTPFFWLGDTAWNGALKSRGEDWDDYLAMRRSQGFTAVQFVCTQWRAAATDHRGEKAYEVDGRLRINPAFFQRLDARVAAANEQYLVAAPVMLWAYGEEDPGRALAEEDAIRLARYMVARWGAYQVVWILGGDADYRGAHADRWKRLGRAVFGERRDRLVTLHPQGLHWVAQEFRDESWYDFIGYQSGHGDSDEDLRWLTGGPPASQWAGEPARPVVNLEPNYEAHPAYQSGKPFTDREVRRAAYWSLLVSPTAGLTFGHNSIWAWQEEPAAP
ncbi:MAG: apiosidase-like domain-containing protein, partial [Planctomycetota bacterium]